MMRRLHLTGLEIALVLVGVVGFVMMLRVVWVQGIGYDAAFEMEAYLAVRDLGPVTSLAQAYDIAPITSEFYGLLSFQLADAIAGWLGIVMSPDVAAAYVLHHYVIVAMSVSATILMGVATSMATRSRTAGLFAAVLLLVTPLWMGMGTMNYKDVPVAAGLTGISAALIVAWRSGRVFPPLVIAAVSGFVTLGTRAGSLLLIVGLVVASVALFALGGIVTRQARGILASSLSGVSAIVAALLGVWATNPFARLDISTWLIDSYAISREYIWVGVIRTAGMDLPSTELPWWYAPVWLLAQLPLATTALLIVVIVTVLLTLVKPSPQLTRGDLVAISPYAVQGLLLPLAIIAGGAVLYDGIRHLLFAIPGIIALTALPAGRLMRSYEPRLVWRAATLALGVVVGLSLFACIRWFPYPYAFINPVAGSDRNERDWELDFWGLTSREGVERLRNPDRPTVAVVPAAETGRPFGAVGGDAASAETAATGIPHGIYVFRRWDAQFRQDWCTRLFTIERDGHILGEGGTCP